MSDKTDMGGHSPAHPVVTGNHVHATGITTWDYYAAAALNGLLSTAAGWDDAYITEASEAADAMLAERAKRTGGNS